MGVNTVGLGASLGTPPPPLPPWLTLFVAKIWPLGGWPGLCFTTITDALIQAQVMGPSSTNQIGIVVFPGIYTEDVVLVSNVMVVQAIRGTVRLAGNALWQPGAGGGPGGPGGPNAAQTYDTESLTWQISFDDPPVGTDPRETRLLKIDSTGKMDGNVVFHMYQSQLQAITAIGRHNNSDNLFFEDVIFLESENTFTNVTGSAKGLAGVELWHCRVRGMTFAGSTRARIDGGECAKGAHKFTDTAKGVYTGVDILSAISAEAACNVTITGEIDFSEASVKQYFSGDGTFDLRGCNIGDNSYLTGDGTTSNPGITGTCNRTTWTSNTQQLGPTRANTNFVVPIAPAYPDNLYNVVLQPTAGPANGVLITEKTPSSFTIYDTVGDNIFDVTIIHD